MKYLRQAAVILLFCFLGEVLEWLIPLPVPAAIYGLLLLFAALALGVVRLRAVEDTGGFLLTIMPVLFIAPAVGILGVWDVIQPFLLPIGVLIAASTLISFGVSGVVTQRLLKEKDDGAE